MKPSRWILPLVAAVICVLIPTMSYATTLTVTPDEVIPGQTVTARVSAAFTVTPLCQLQIDFGDGSGWQDIPGGPCTLGDACLSRSDTHVYSKAGTFTVAVRNSPTQCNPGREPVPPWNPTAKVTVLAGFSIKEIVLPPGVTGVEYEQRLEAGKANVTFRFQRLSGTLPPGLEVRPNGTISGIPTKEGRYRFTVRAGTQRGRFYDQKYLLEVTRAPLEVTVTPPLFAVSRSGGGSGTVVFALRSPARVDATLRSERGEFRAGGRLLGVNQTPLIVLMTAGRGETRETVRIPQAVLDAAGAAGATRIEYRRTFDSLYTESDSASSGAVVKGDAGGELDITRMRIYFPNNRPKITVKRNDRDLSAAVEIGFTGSGLLEGRWEVDGRLIHRELRQLVHGRPVVVELPEALRLPTFAVGVHRVRFEVTRPEEALPPPEAIYFVTAAEDPTALPIALLEPGDASRLPAELPSFRWQAPERARTYRIDFIRDSDGETLFTAYTRTPQYQVPAEIRKQLFAAGGAFRWSVTGYDLEDAPCAASGERTFNLEAAGS
jgi:hypothetical protein